ncbi:PriCT-2 domain-containing protein [Paraburkholderia sp. BCC1885]|uniref:PriCT-2 domain-containing protein n=1 Tax=Paraburkholderia sp. BCC1885 TaxID=2562669 RepID=UPI0021B19B3B|nr:PriCT-2 domain-containing protein [Paraburkholderia sp. BCC1885]
MNTPMNTPFATEADRVRAALSVIPAEDYETWVDMAFAVKSGLGEAGFDLWDTWSRTAANYDERSARTTWKSVREEGGKTLASLFWLARQYGFDPAAWRSGRPAPVSPAHREHEAAALEERRRRAQADLDARHRAAGTLARRLWEEAWGAEADHPYLVRKGLPAATTLRELDAPDLQRLAGYTPHSEGDVLTGRVLLVPVYIDDAISTVEFIDEAGRKSTLAGGAKADGYWATGVLPPSHDEPGPIVVAEGMATALSVHLATGWFALAALSAGNLPKVAQVWRDRYPDAEIVILGDRGRGEEFAQRAAHDINGRLAIPVFASEARLNEELPTDFNDLAVLAGPEAVRGALTHVLDGPVAKMSPRVTADAEQDGVSNRRDAGDIGIDGVGSDDGEAGFAVISGSPEEDRIMGKVKAAMEGSRPQDVRDAVQGSDQDNERNAELAVAGTQAAASASRRQVGEPLYMLADVPDEIKALGKHRFGADIRMGTPRENGGPYRGEVFDTDGYLIQEVALRSVVFHSKERADFVSERLKWAADHQRLNGMDIQIGYDGDVPKVYPWDRARDHLDRAVASLKKSAKELGLGDEVVQTLDRLQTQSWSRVKDARRAVLSRAKERSDPRNEPRNEPRSEPTGQGRADRSDDGPQR